LLSSAKDSLPYSVANVKPEEIFDAGDSNKFQSIVLELFDPKYYEDSAVITDFREHPVFIKFKDLLRNALEEFNHRNESKISIPQFLYEFDSIHLFKLEEEKKDNEDLRNLLRKWEVNSDFQKLQDYLKNGDLFFESNKSHHIVILMDYDVVPNQLSSHRIP